MKKVLLFIFALSNTNIFATEIKEDKIEEETIVLENKDLEATAESIEEVTPEITEVN